MCSGLLPKLVIISSIFLFALPRVFSINFDFALFASCLINCANQHYNHRVLSNMVARLAVEVKTEHT